MSKQTQTHRRGHRGTALTELAVTIPFLFLLTMGVTDFGRLFYHALTITHAAGVASEFGSQSNIDAVNYTGMQTVAIADAYEIDGVNATAAHKCVCSAAGAEVSCALTSCGGAPPRVYVKVDVEHNFQTLGIYPEIPSSTMVGRDAWRRVQ